MNISEVYELFKRVYPNAAIGKFKFASLRPEHVLLSSQIPRNVCVCQKHENISLILQALHNLDKNVPLYSHALPESIVCSDNRDKCWNNLCETCKDAELFSELYHLDDGNLEKEVIWYQWKMVPGKN